MAEKRERRLLDDEPVTIIGHGAKRGYTKIRNQFGFVQDVKTGKLKKMPRDDPRASFEIPGTAD